MRRTVTQYPNPNMTTGISSCHDPVSSDGIISGSSSGHPCKSSQSEQMARILIVQAINMT
jgi:hypothetical protein